MTKPQAFPGRVAASAVLLCGLAGLSGCALNSAGVTASLHPSYPMSVSGIGGVLHGGPNPVVGARVVIYATTSNGYGVGTALQEATQRGTSAHQDTDSSGNFSFAGGFVCPVGQYAYVVAYGGNTGANAVNPNSVLVAPLGACSALYNPTTNVYLGPTVWVNELTTAATAYALGNFLNVAGDPVNGLTVGIGATATNNATTPCVANDSFYPTCTATSVNGLGHAFTLATQLVNNTTGQANATTVNGALVPAAEFNALGNILQACVNSTGGGTSSSGSPTSTPTTQDGTLCGKLFAYTSYSVTNATTSAVTNYYPTNTLSALQNLAKRPAGAGTLWDTTCSTTTNGSVPTPTCLFNLAASTPFYGGAITSAPSDWMLSILYLKGAFASSGTTNTCTVTGSSNTATGQTNGTVTATNNGISYPWSMALDINDNVYIANNDNSTENCQNFVAFTNNGASIFTTAWDPTNHEAYSLATDTLGHIIVPSVTPFANYSSTPNTIRVLSASTGADLTAGA